MNQTSLRIVGKILISKMFPTITTTILTPSWIGLANASTTVIITPPSPDMNISLLGNVSGVDETTVNETNLFNMCDPSNPEFNCSVEDFLSFYLGAKQMPLETAIWVSLK